MSNTELAPDQVACRASRFTGVLQPRDVPLGGPRAIRVRRTLPQRKRSLIGAWCFVDHYGPHDARSGTAMDVPPHPHTGLQTVSWLFDGRIEHRDSAGVHAMIRPGELNLMTAGAGICHSEVSDPESPVLHGVQLWVALPDADRDTARDFIHYVPTVRTVGAAEIRVFIGELADARSPVHTFTPLVGAQVDLAPGASVELPVDSSFEHGVLLDQGTVEAGETTLGEHGPGELWYQSPGHDGVALDNRGQRPARMLLLGGVPFPDELVMWWNFVGRSHDDIVGYRRQWEEHDARFGSVTGYPGVRLPAPPLPNSILLPRPTPATPGET